RLVMGKPTPCVGREQELSQLEAVLRSCIEESTARVVLVTAPSGYGKTRLRHEFLRRVERSGERVEVLVGYGNPRGEDLLFPVLRNALVTLFGFQSSDAGAVTAQKLLDRVSLRVDPAIAGRVSALLGELCGAPVGDDGSAELREARKDPKGMADLIARAFMDLLRAECKAGPVLLLLEDLQWIDAPTLRLLDGALRELAHEPFMVLALSRPEIEELLPKLWNERGALRLRLPGLSRKASKRLVAEVLGVGADSPAVERIAGQAQGNALLLEELMRAEMEGREDAPPDTALAILQSYMLRLDTNTRRVLRGAAIFGGTFWRGGLNALYASSITAQMLDASLTALVDAAFIERRPESRFEGEVEYAFCHALLRDAAYRLLTDEDRALGHRIVGEYMTRIDRRPD
ncbi:MAG TPA: AAA family ATPase, partial [Polyangiaceae bacterium]|nr:AAA family ATPase [Polyangiaceae bacterium]